MIADSRIPKKELCELYSRDSRGDIHLNVKSVLFGGYDPVETGKVVEQLNSYYRDIIVSLVQEITEKDRELSDFRRRNS